MKFIISTILLSILSLGASAQLNCGKVIPADKVAFKGGEELNYTVTYNSAMVNTSIADVRLTVEDIVWGAIPVFKTLATAKTRPFYNVFFKLENRYEGVMDKSRLRPIIYSTMLREGGYRYSSSYAYNWNNNTVRTTGHNVKRNRTYNKSQGLLSCSYDPMALFYNMRCMDGDNVGPGYKLSLNLLLEDTIRTITFRFVKREVRDVPGVGKFRVMKFVGDLATQTDDSFEDGSQFSILISDDKNHIPIFLESPIKVGRIQATLSSWKSLKYPLESLIVGSKT